MNNVVELRPKTRFKEKNYFDRRLEKYSLLPFRFIKLYKDKYILTNEVGEYLVLDRDTLVAFIRKELPVECETYYDLKSKHFLLDSDSLIPLELLALKYRTKFDPISSFTSLHMFVVTLRCEHSCPYCQVSRQTDNKMAYDMSIETADRALDFTFQSPSKYIKIEFQGGEPLLNFDLIKYIVHRAEERNLIEKRYLQFVIATNLALIDDAILSFCQDHEVYISTSLDGPRDLHNLNRPRPGKNSYELTIEGINKVRSVLGPDKISALMTTTQRSLPQVKEIIDEYLKQKFNSIFLRPISPYGFAMRTKTFHSYHIDEWLKFYKLGLDYIIEINKSGLFFIEQYAAIILNKILSPLGNTYVDLQSPSGIGINCIVFNYDGNVYASDESRMLKEMGDEKFCIGNLYTDSYRDIMLSDSLLDPIEQTLLESSPMCNDCAFLPYCGSDPVYHYATQGDYVGNKLISGFCKKNMSIFRYLISLMEQDKETAAIFRSWIRI